MDEKLKELLAKRKYFSEHPEEARKEYVKKCDGFEMLPEGVPPRIEKKDN